MADKQKQTDYKREFNEKNYDRLYPYIKKGKKGQYQAAADRMGISLNEFIEQACDYYANR